MFQKGYNNSPRYRAVGTIVNNLEHYDSAPTRSMRVPDAWVLLGDGNESTVTLAGGVITFSGYTSTGIPLEIPVRNFDNPFSVNVCREDAKKKIKIVVPVIANLHCEARMIGITVVTRQSENDSRRGSWDYYEPLTENCGVDWTRGSLATRLAARINTDFEDSPVVATVVNTHEIEIESRDGKEFFVDGLENVTNVAGTWNTFDQLVAHSSEAFKGKNLEDWGIGSTPYTDSTCLRILNLFYYEDVRMDGHATSSSQEGHLNGHYVRVKKSLAVVSDQTGASATKYNALVAMLNGTHTPASAYYAVTASIPVIPTPV